MDGYTNLYGMLETALKQAGEESGMLLGQELDIALLDSLSTSKSSYFGGLDDGCFVLGVDSGEGSGEARMRVDEALGLESALRGPEDPGIEAREEPAELPSVALMNAGPNCSAST